MAAPCFIAWNAATSALTAAPTHVSTGTSLRTMLQIKAGTPKFRLVEWGYSFDVVPTAVVRVELLTTGTVGATTGLTALAAADIRAYNDTTGAASQVVSGGSNGTATSGYGAITAEGSITSTREIAQQHEWGQQFKQQFPLGREPEVNGGEFLRIRATTATAVNMSCYVIWEE